MSETATGEVTGRHDEAQDKVPVKRKRGSIVIAEDLDFWQISYMFIVALLFVGNVSSIPAALGQSNFESAFAPSVSAYTNSLTVWGGLFTISSIALTLRHRENPIVQGRRIRIFVRARSFTSSLFITMFGVIASFVPIRFVPSTYQQTLAALGGFFISAFLAVAAIIGPGLLIYVLNPAAKRFLLEYPFGFREKLKILGRFREYDILTSARFSFLLAEVFKNMWLILERGFPYLQAEGVEDTFVDIQLAMRVGTDDEKQAVETFFNNVYDLKYRIGSPGTSYSNDVLKELHDLRAKFTLSEELRTRNGINGDWHRNLITLVEAYQGWIQVGLAVALLVIAVLTLIIR